MGVCAACMVVCVDVGDEVLVLVVAGVLIFSAEVVVARRLEEDQPNAEEREAVAVAVERGRAFSTGPRRV